MSRTVRIGVDIGGTFTDFVFHDGSRGITRTGKRATTVDNPGRAIIEGIARLLAETGTTADRIHSIIHGTTLVTNTVLERSGAKVGLLATRGHIDAVEMGRETRYDVDDLAQRPALVIVPRHLRRGVGGRITADGSEAEPLNEEQLLIEIDDLVRKEKIDSLAIAFMNSYRNPAHEVCAMELVRRRYPDLLITASSQVAPVIREYERTNTACVNAYVQPRVKGYLERLTDDLAAIGFAGELSIMLSSGGLTSIEEAKSFPVRLIESGPAAGAMGVAYIARKMGLDHVISFDMGGTTAKMCLIEEGHPHVKHDFEAGRLERFKPGSGLPLKVTVIDMIEIGAGGGSIAAIDGLGLMKAGPKSAGSVPGPVCYGKGGTAPTVTDADLLLGYLDKDFFLGGEMALQLEAVKDAVASTLAAPLAIDTFTAARGVRSIVNENMAAATRMHLAEKGKDPRDYTMVAFGGAGPVHAYDLARLLKLRRLIVPMGAGVISAFGFLVAAPAVDAARGYLSRLETVSWDEVNAFFAGMEERASSTLSGMAIGGAEITYAWSADMRYLGQGFDINVPLPRGPLGPGDLPAIHAAFEATYRELFGRVASGIPVEAVNWRLAASLPEHDISLAYETLDHAAERGRREVHFAEHGPLQAMVYDRYALKEGTRIQGPAVFEERETTFIVGPEATVTVDAMANLVVEIAYPDSGRMLDRGAGVDQGSGQQAEPCHSRLETA